MSEFTISLPEEARSLLVAGDPQSLIRLREIMLTRLPASGTEQWVVVSSPDTMLRPKSRREYAELGKDLKWHGWTTPGYLPHSRFPSRDSALVLVEQVRRTYPDAVAVPLPKPHASSPDRAARTRAR